MNAPSGDSRISTVVPTTDVVRALLDPATPTNDPVVQFFQVALSGFGYDFYNPANNARANDLLVREKGSGMLADAAHALGVLERRYHDRFIPPPSREHPYPPADDARRVKRVHALESACRTVSSALLTAESPGSDAIWSRVRDYRTTLEALLAIDMQLIASVSEISSTIGNLDVTAVQTETPLDTIETLLERLTKLIDARRAALTI